MLSSWCVSVASDSHTATEEQEADGDRDAVRQRSPNTQQAARAATLHTREGAEGKQEAALASIDGAAGGPGSRPSLLSCTDGKGFF